jgi:deoxyguanosine kinase
MTGRRETGAEQIMFRVDICGGIGSGKSSLAQAFENIFPGEAKVVREKYREVPFWKDFYRDPAGYELQKNISFALFHSHLIRGAQPLQRIICDFAFFQDLAYASLSKRHEDVSMIEAIHSRLERDLPPVSLIVRLVCKSSTQLRRIEIRGRIEEAGITAQYLDRLNSAIDVELSRLKERTKVAVLAFDTDEIDVRDEQTARRACTLILSAARQAAKISASTR